LGLRFAVEVRKAVCYPHIWESLAATSKKAGIPHISSHAFRDVRSWLDPPGLPVGLQQRMMRHASVTTTMDHYGTALTAEMRIAHERIFAQVTTGKKAI
jgi:integrase